MVISKSRLIKQSLLIIISLFIGFLIGAAWMYYDQQNEIRQLISESRALFESQRLTIDNQQEVYTLVINCGYDPQRCDPQTFLDELDSLTEEKTKLDQEVETSSEKVETTIKNNGWNSYKS